MTAPAPARSTGRKPRASATFRMLLATCALLLLTTLLGQLPQAQAIDAIRREGKYLLRPDGSRFMIKGIAYQEAAPLAASTAESTANGGFPEPDSYVDALESGRAADCRRDVVNLVALG